MDRVERAAARLFGDPCCRAHGRGIEADERERVEIGRQGASLTVELVAAAGNVVEVRLADVEERRPDLSAMPEDLAGMLTAEEMRDLIAYVSSL